MAVGGLNLGKIAGAWLEVQLASNLPQYVLQITIHIQTISRIFRAGPGGGLARDCAGACGTVTRTVQQPYAGLCGTLSGGAQSLAISAMIRKNPEETFHNSFFGRHPRPESVTAGPTHQKRAISPRHAKKVNNRAKSGTQPRGRGKGLLNGLNA